jgi:hypothetical protein
MKPLGQQRNVDNCDLQAGAQQKRNRQPPVVPRQLANGATDSHVQARLTSTILPTGGQTTVELPQADEELFLYFVDGDGRFQTTTHAAQIDLYDTLLATPKAEAPLVTAGERPLNFLSFYLKPFMSPSLS